MGFQSTTLENILIKLISEKKCFSFSMALLLGQDTVFPDWPQQSTPPPSPPAFCLSSAPTQLQ